MAVDRSDEAFAIAGQLAGAVFYPRMADVVRHAIRHCASEGCALDDDQCTQLYRAAFMAGDGVLDAIAYEVDLYAVQQIEREGLS